MALKRNASSKAKAKARCITREQLIQKKIADNFKGFRSEWIDVHTIQGLTLRQTLMRDYSAHLEGKEPHQLGKSYYDKLRAAFKQVQKDAAGIKVADDTLPLNPRLIQAMCAAKRAHPDRGPLVAWMQTIRSINQTEFCGLVRFWMSLKVKCTKQLSCAMEAARMIHRLGLHTQYIEEFSVLRSWLDEVFEGALARSRSFHTDDMEFCALNRNLLILLMREDDFDLAVKHKGTKVDLGDSLNRLVASSQVGLKIFSSSIQSVLGEHVQKTINNYIDDFFKGKRSADEYLEAQTKCQAAVDLIGCIDLLPPRRKITLTYRRQVIPIAVRSTQEQVQLSFACALKTLGADSGQLEELWVESFLVGSKVQPMYKAELPNSLFAAASSARSRIKQAMLDAQAVTGELVQLKLGKCMADLVILGSTFKIEVGMITELTGEGTGERMKSLVKLCLPTSSRRSPPETSAQALHNLANGDAFKLAERTLQERVKLVQSYVNTLAMQQMPHLAAAMDQPWLPDIVAQFQYFLVAQKLPEKADKDKRNKNSVPIEVSGKDAIPIMLSDAEAAISSQTITLQQVLIFRAFRWLLTDAQWAKAQDLISSAEAAMQNDLGESLKKRARKGAKPKACTDVDQAMQSSLDLFK